jgi:head-tail adaptor
MISAGQRNHRVRFDRRLPKADDGFGNELDDWSALTTCRAGFRPKFGREQLAAGVLESTLQGTLTLRRFPATAGVTAADRAVFVSGPYAGKICQIRSVVPTPDNREFEMLLEEGVAV